MKTEEEIDRENEAVCKACEHGPDGHACRDEQGHPPCVPKKATPEAELCSRPVYVRRDPVWKR